MRNQHPPRHQPSNSPTACPFCGSPRILTASEKIDASSYWRCEACGDVWNLARVQAAAGRNTYGARWR
jgi:transposase-like protein